LLITYINIANVELFGEIEFWLASIKIIALMIFVVLSGLIFFGIIHGSQPEGIIGTKFIYGEGGFFPNGGLALLTAMVLLLVNYQGTEIIGLAAGESIDPEIMIPSAIRNVTLRILFIYIIPVFCLVLIYPWSKANIATPVFSDVLSYYGLKKVGAVISFVTVTAALSCANSGVYGIARSLNALARGGMAPKKLALLNEHAVPQNAVIVTLLSIWLLLAIGGFFGQSKLYIALLLVSGFTGLMAWVSICLSQINFRNLLYKAGYTVNDLKYKTPGSPYTGIFAIILMCGCLLFLLFHENLLYIMAFVIGCISFIVPIGIYKFNNLINARSVKYDKKPARNTFYEIFPKCKPK
jgi:AAT family amino acid transporter